MCLMASANHLFIVFLAVEMASVPSYALAGMLKGRRQSSEAALKYAVYGAGTAGVMLYGISLLTGALGTAHIPTMAIRLAELINSGGGSDRYMVLALGGLMLMVGICFKLSAVPFHFWCPDVFEGASAEVNAFLSVASKAAALVLLVRVAIGLGSIPERTLAALEPPAAQTSTEPTAAIAPTPEAPATSTHLAVYRHAAQEGDQAAPAGEPAAPAREHAAPAGETAAPVNEHPAPAVDAAADMGAAPAIGPADRAQLISKLAPVRRFMLILVTIISAITCTFGNWTAYGQTNIKRLLAYSTIAHAGYMMMPVAAALAAIGVNDAAARDAIGYLGFYIGAYLFMNLGAFAIVAFLRNAIRSEEIADYAGLFRHAPVVVICFGIILVSLIGIPPLAGYMAKFAIFASLVETEQYALLVVGGFNTVLSLFYYLRVIWVMAVEPEPENRLPFSLPATSLEGVFVVLITAPVITLGLWGNWLFEWMQEAASQLLS
jgi:NADH-quinone oxidoreductase subunit N